MEIIVQVFVATLLSVASLLGGGNVFVSVPDASVEIGLREMSPKGELGGFAIPASGYGQIHNGLPEHDCPSSAPDIRVDKPIVRSGEPVIVTWDPKANVGCTLSATVTRLVTSPNPTTAPNANATGSRIDTPTGETTYAIVCTGSGNSDVVVAKILPRIQET
jgi:hypothetical protein